MTVGAGLFTVSTESVQRKVRDNQQEEQEGMAAGIVSLLKWENAFEESK